MIEYGELTKLDDDYITILSDYLLYEDKERVMDNITKLAELGQINAIQTYYILDGKDNQKIEKHIYNIINNKPKNFNEKLALARYYDNKNSEFKIVNAFIDEYNLLINELKESPTHPNFYYYKRHEVSLKVDKIIEQLCGLKSCHNEVNAISTLQNLPFQTPRLTEIELELRKQSIVHKMKNEFVNSKEVKKVRKALLLDVKNSYNDVASKYYLAKNIARFGGNKKEIQLGRKLLLELSNRSLSINNIKTVEEKQVKDETKNIEKN